MPSTKAKAEESAKEPIQLTCLVGNAGGNAEKRSTSKGDVVNFSLAVTPTTEDGAVQWFRVAVWNNDLQSAVIRQIKKGARVAVIGKAYETEFNDKPQYNMNAYRVGLVDFLRRDEASDATTHDEEVGW